MEKIKCKLFIFRTSFSINKNIHLKYVRIIRRNLKIKFIIETYLRILSKFNSKSKESRSDWVKVGIESSSLEVLKDTNRYTVTKDTQIEKVKFLENNNIKVSMYIIGYQKIPKTIMETLNYSIKLNTAFAQFAVWTPYPGTPVFKEYEEKIITNKFEDFTQYQLVFKHKNLLPKDVRKLLSKCYEKYYLRYSWIIKKILFKN